MRRPNTEMLRVWRKRAARTIRKLPLLGKAALHLRLIGDEPRVFLLKILPEGSVGAEVGVHLGDFSEEILLALKPKRLHLIDPWKYEPDVTYSEALYGGAAQNGQNELDRRHQAVLQRFRKPIDRGTIEIHRLNSKDAATAIADNSLDWVYIDGNHQYEYVRDDLNAFFDKVKVGGYLCGDDYGQGGWWKGGVKTAVDEFLETPEVELVDIRNAQFVIKKTAGRANESLGTASGA